MRSRLGPVVLVAALTTVGAGLAGCGSDAERADDPATAPTTSPTTDSTGPAGDPAVVDIVSESAGGGRVSTTPTYVGDDLALLRYVQQFESGRMAAKVTEAVEAYEPGPGRVVAAAVIAIGCDVPPSASVTESGDGLQVVSGKVVSAHQECYVPVTSVAVLDLPADALPSPPTESQPTAD